MPTHRPRLPTLPLLSLALLTALLPATEAQAQDTSVQWTQVTRIEAAGVLGTLIGQAPGVNSQSEHAIHILGRQLRQDDGSGTTILNLDDLRMVTLDHERRHYTQVSAEEMRESARAMAEFQLEMREEIEAEMAELQAELEADLDEAMAMMRQAMEESAAAMNVEIDTEATGETRSFGPASAGRHFLTVKVEAADGLEAVDDAEGGTLVLLVDLWQSHDFPSAERLHEQFAEEMAREMAADDELVRMGQEMAEMWAPVAESFRPEALSMVDPRVAAALDRTMEVIGTLGGTTVSSVTYVALVPEGVEFHRDALLAWEPESMGEQLTGAATDAARDAAADAARDAVRGLTRGLLGRRGGDDEDEVEEEVAATRPLFKLHREMTDIRIGTPSPDLFTIPGDYTRFDLPVFDDLPGSMRDPR